MKVKITDIIIGERKRPVSNIEQLKKSISEIGLLNPITITPDNKLVAGYHRLEAVKQLGWIDIPVNIIEANDLRAELAEIDENIVRNQLGEVMQGVQLARRKEIYEELYPETKHGHNSFAGNQHTNKVESGNYCHSPQAERFTENTAKSTGKSERTIRDKTRIGKTLKPIAAKIQGTHIDKQKELTALTKIADKKKGEGIEVAEEVLDIALSESIGVNLAYSKLKQKRGSEEITKNVKEEVNDLPEFDVKYGQLWKCGNHTVICSDIKELRNIKADAIISDPPYGIDYAADWNKWNGDVSNYNKVHGDNEPFDPSPFLKYDKILLFGANYFANKLPLGGWLCWDKRTKPHLDNMLGSPFELAWYRSTKTKRSAMMIRVLHGGVVNADSQHGNNAKRYHPTQKPVEVMRQILIELTESGDTVLDPFSGSGSTLIACEKTDRKCIAVEIDPEYVKTILIRYYQLTNNLPCLESNV